MADNSLKLRTLEGGVPMERDPIRFLAGVLPQTPLIRAGVETTLGGAIASAAQTGHTPVNDTNYTILPSDVQIGVVSLTAPRTVYLPDVDAFPLGQDLVIADESGVCSETLTITIQPGADTGDTIGNPDGSPSIVLFTPYQAVRFRRGAANLWIRV